MSFKLQKLANGYPVWTKVRSDPSSLGQRYLSIFADYFDQVSVDNVKFYNDNQLLKVGLGLSRLYRINLLGSDQITLTPTIGGGRTPTYHTAVDGNHPILGVINLIHDMDLEDLISGHPTRVTLLESYADTKALIWDRAAPNTFGTIVRPERLTIDISNSSLYQRVGDKSPGVFSGFTGLILKGLDHNGLEFRERIVVRDDYVYKTKNIFSKLLEANVDGFDGDVKMYAVPTTMRYINDPYHTAVLPTLEGPLKLSLNPYTYNLNTYASIRYFTDRLKLGSEYRHKAVSGLENNTEKLADITLLTDAGSPYNAIDIAISDNNTKLYVLADDGSIYVYDHGLKSFLPQADKTSRRTYIVPQAVEPRAILGETMKLFTWHKFPRYIITSVAVKRVDPNGIVEYLQDDLTWGTGIVQHYGKGVDSTTPEQSWSDLTFSTTFTVAGQWEFYTITTTANDVTTSHTAVRVETLTASVKLNTGVTAPTGIFFSEDNSICVTDSSTVYKFQEHRDAYFVDVQRQQIILREQYDSVEVTP